MRRSLRTPLASPFAVFAVVAFLLLSFAGIAAADGVDVWERVDHKMAPNGDVEIHYVTLGEGKPVLFVHGFPDFWYSWRNQMDVLSRDYKTAALDLRGYNRSGQPEGVENYALPLILTDVKAVIEDMGAEKVTLVGHDWGGAIAWNFAMNHPEMVERLVILNLTHPKGYAAVVADPTPEQAKNVEYAKRFASSEPDGSPVPPQIMAMSSRMGDVIGARYREAYERSSYDGMVNYYRANYGRISGDGVELPNLPMPVLQFHGLKDTAVDKDGLKNTWDWIDADYTLVSIPSAGHFVQWEAADMVSQTMRAWLQQRDR